MVDPTIDKPLYLQIRDILGEKVQSGEYAPGSRLETENELSSMYGVSRITLRQALSELEKDGLITRVKGKGTFAKGPARETPDTANRWIALVGTDFNAILQQQVVKGVEAALEGTGYGLRFLATNDDGGETERMVRLAVDQGAAGILAYPADNTLYSEAIDELTAKGYPICLFDRVYERVTTDCAMLDHFTAGKLAASHLLGLGYDRIGFIAEASTKTTAIKERLAGLIAAHAARGMEHDPNLVHTAVCENGGSWESAARDLLGKGPRAVVVVNDWLAVDFMRIAGSLGINVPGEVAVVGFDNWEAGAKFLVPLTTVAQPFEGIGKAATTLLLDRIEGRVEPGNHRWSLLKPTLVVRESCGSGLIRGV